MRSRKEIIRKMNVARSLKKAAKERGDDIHFVSNSKIEKMLFWVLGDDVPDQKYNSKNKKNDEKEEL